MAITKTSACALQATGFYSDDVTPIIPGGYTDLSLIYYSVLQYCNNDTNVTHTIYQKVLETPLVSFSLTSGTFPGYVAGTATINFDRSLTFVSGTRFDGTNTVTLNTTNWNSVNINTNNTSVTYTYTIIAKDLANNTYNFIYEFSVINNSYLSSSSLVTMLNSTINFTDNTSYITEPQFVTIDTAGVINFSDYAFGGSTEDIIDDGVYNVTIKQQGYTNNPDISIGTYTLSTTTTSQCISAFCNLLCNAVQASTVENLDKTELWALLEALKQAEVCTICNSDLCNIIEYVQSIINEIDCKC